MPYWPRPTTALFVSHHSIFRKQVQQWTVDQLETIGVGPSGVEINDRPVMELQIQPKAGGKYGLLSERTDDELVWIAAELNQSLGRPCPKELVPNRHDLHVPAAERDASGDVVLPENSQIVMGYGVSGLEIRVPPAGFVRHVGAIVVGGLFTAVGMGVTVGVAWSELKDGFQAGDLTGLIFISIWTLLFTGVGLAVFVSGLVAARRRFDIRVAGKQLHINRYGPFGRREFAWAASDIESVQVADSGIKVNSRSLPQVKVIPRQGPPLGILTDRSVSELSAVAAALRDALGMAESGER